MIHYWMITYVFVHGKCTFSYIYNYIQNGKIALIKLCFKCIR